MQRHVAEQHDYLDSQIFRNSIQYELDFLFCWLRLHGDLTVAVCSQGHKAIFGM